MVNNKKIKMAEKENKGLSAFLANAKKTYGATKAKEMFVEDVHNITIEKFPTGSLLLDKALKGGYPFGKIVEFSGGEASGKTTSAIHASKEHQEYTGGEPILWVDLEDVFDSEYFSKIGIDLSEGKFILVKPETGEDAWNLMIDFARNVPRGLIVLDSVSVLLPAKENEGEVGDAQMAAAARMNSQGLRKIMPHLSKNRVTFFVINQIRVNIGGYGDPNVTTGGKGWGFYARTRVRTSRQKGEQEISSKNKFKIIKATYGIEDAVIETAILYGEGIDTTGELISLALEQGLVEKSGSWFSYDGTKLGQGRNGVKSTFDDNPELFEDIKSKIDFS